MPSELPVCPIPDNYADFWNRDPRKSYSNQTEFDAEQDRSYRAPCLGEIEEMVRRVVREELNEHERLYRKFGAVPGELAVLSAEWRNTVAAAGHMRGKRA